MLEQATGPVSIGMLAFGQSSRHRKIPVDIKLAMFVGFRQILQHLGKSGKYPAVTTRPKVLLAAEDGMLGIDKAAVTVVQPCFRVVHHTVCIRKVFVQLFQIKRIFRDSIQFGHHGHHHIKPVSPPPVVIFISPHLILQHFTGTGYPPVITPDAIQIGIGLEATLPIAEEHILRSLAITVFPLRLIVRSGSFPMVVFRPIGGIFQIRGVTGQFIDLHIARVIGSIVPKRTYLRRVVFLPVTVHFVNDAQQVFSRLRNSTEKLQRSAQDKK